MYMKDTKFELRHWDDPQHMHRTMLYLGVGLNWHTEGDAEKDPEQYRESFDLIDSSHPENNREGMTRAQCDQACWDIYCDEYYNN